MRFETDEFDSIHEDEGDEFSDDEIDALDLDD